jgi:hypothetical protein
MSTAAYVNIIIITRIKPTGVILINPLIVLNDSRDAIIIYMNAILLPNLLIKLRYLT